MADLRGDVSPDAVASRSLASIVEELGDGVLVVEGGVVRYANPAALRLLGSRGPEGVCGLPLHRLLALAPRAELSPGARLVATVPGSPGGPRAVRVRSLSCRWEGREACALVLRDPAAHASDAACSGYGGRFRQVLDASPDAIYVHVGSGTIVYANPAAARLLEADRPEDLVGREVLAYIHPDDRERVGERIRRAQAERVLPESPVVEHLLTSGGRELHVEITGSLLEFDGGDAVQVILRDVTERTGMERALRRREAILAAVGQLAQALLRCTDWESCVADVLGTIGGASGVSRAYLVERHTVEGDGVGVRLCHEWVRPGAGAPVTAAARRPVSLNALGLDRVAELFGRGETFYCRVGDLRERERAGLRGMGIDSLFAVPVMVDDDWWGVLAFGASFGAGEWSAAERDVLAAAAGLLGACIRRQAMEEEVRSLGERMREVLEHSRDISYRLDLRRLQFDYVSPAVERLLGYSADEMVGANLREVIARLDEGDRRRVLAFVREYEERGDLLDDASELEFRWPRADGRVLRLSDHRSTVRDEHGRPVAVVGSLRDVTERQLAAEALRESEERFRGIFDASRETILLFDRDLRVLYANRAALEAAGADAESVLGRSFSAAFGHCTDRVALWEARLATAARRGQPVEFSEHYTVGDREVYAEWSIIPLKRTAGEVYALALVYHDVTEQRLSERALREGEDRFRRLFESMGDAYLLFDDQLRLVDCNETGEALFGITQDTLPVSADRVTERVSLVKGSVVGLLSEALKSGRRRRTGGATLRGPDEGTEATYLDLVAYRIRFGGAPHVALLCRDVSESRRLEAELHRARHLESLGRLASGVAHDFGNLLGVIRGECELLETMLPEDTTVRHEVEAIEQMVAIGASVTRRLIAFGKGEELQEEILQLNALVRHNEGLLRRLARSDVDVRLEFSKDPIYLFGDEGQIARILVNLTTNARDAMPQGGRIRIRTAIQDLRAVRARQLGVKPGPYAVIEVADTGEGIPERDIDRIFDPYFTSKAQGAGAGLGLSVVYGIVTRAGGTISVTSREGRGTRARVYLPAIDPADILSDQ